MSLLTKYRPQTVEQIKEFRYKEWKQVEKALDNGMYSFLFSGPAGVGKTTLAYVIANYFDNFDVVEIDAASQSGVDNIRELVENVSAPSISTQGYVVIIDEVQRLSSSAYDALLKPLESGSDNIVWVLATTEPDKLPKTVVQRCLHLRLGPFRRSDIEDLLFAVVEQEDLDVPEEVVQLAAKAGEGIPRLSLNNLQAVLDCDSREEASKIINKTIGNKGAKETMKLYMEGEWDELFDALIELGESLGAEEARRAVCFEASRLAERAEELTEVQSCANVLGQFVDPLDPSVSWPDYMRRASNLVLQK